MGKSPVSGLIPRFRPPINYDQLPLDNSREHQWGKVSVYVHTMNLNAKTGVTDS